jgi:hypothetical protein
MYASRRSASVFQRRFQWHPEAQLRFLAYLCGAATIGFSTLGIGVTIVAHGVPRLLLASSAFWSLRREERRRNARRLFSKFV